MPRVVAPIGDGGSKLIGRHPAVRSCHERKQALLAGGCKRLHIAFEHGLERLFGLPFRMLRGHDLDPVEDECNLKVRRLFRPQRAIVVERSDALRRRHEVGAAFLGHVSDEIDDCASCGAFVPRRQNVVGKCREARCEQHGNRDHEMYDAYACSIHYGALLACGHIAGGSTLGERIPARRFFGARRVEFRRQRRAIGIGPRSYSRHDKNSLEHARENTPRVRSDKARESFSALRRRPGCSQPSRAYPVRLSTEDARQRTDNCAGGIRRVHAAARPERSAGPPRERTGAAVACCCFH
jgi:hypothetical protein